MKYQDWRRMSKQKKKLVPELRFPEFENDGEWNIEPLGRKTKEIKDKAGDQKYKLMSITSGEGLVSQLEKFGREIAGNSYKNYLVIKKGDFAYNKSSTKLYAEGEIAMLETEKEGAVPNSIFTCFRFNSEEILPDFAKYPFLNNIHGFWLRKFITVGARANGALQVKTSDLFALPFPYPSPKEQQKIASCLSSLDELITTENDKLKVLKEHKTGLMQQLFPAEGEKVPKLRFPEFRDSGEWEELRLGNLLDFVMGNAFKSSDFVEDGLQLVRMGNLYQGDLQLNRTPVYLPKSFKNEFSRFLIKSEDLLMSMTGTMGKRDYGFVIQVPKNSPDLLLNQRVVKIIPKKNSIIEFVLQLLKSEVFLLELYSIPGGTKQANLSIKDLKEIKVSIPKHQEQQKIASCFLSLDEQISMQWEKIETLKEHKKGLMQRLFPTA